MFMKNILLIGFFMFVGTSAFAFYDFCESPADYNTFPQAYDVRTEYWKDIPNYEPEDIKYKNMENENPIFPIKFKKKQRDDKQPNES